jgi:hypothetical protein
VSDAQEDTARIERSAFRWSVHPGEERQGREVKQGETLHPDSRAAFNAANWGEFNNGVVPIVGGSVKIQPYVLRPHN